MVSSTYLGIDLGFYSSESLDISQNSKDIKYHNIQNIQNKTQDFTVNDFIKISSKKRKVQNKDINIKEERKFIKNSKHIHTSKGHKKKNILNNQKRSLEKKTNFSKTKYCRTKALKELNFTSSDQLNDESTEILLDPIVTSSPLSKSDINRQVYLPLSTHGKRIIVPKEHSWTQILKTKKKRKHILPDNNCIFEGFEDINDNYDTSSAYGKLLFKSSDDIYIKKKSNSNEMKETIEPPFKINSDISSSQEDYNNIYQDTISISKFDINNITDKHKSSSNNNLLGSLNSQNACLYVTNKDLTMIEKPQDLCLGKYSSKNNNTFNTNFFIHNSSNSDISNNTTIKTIGKSVCHDTSVKPSLLFCNYINNMPFIKKKVLFPDNVKKIRKLDTIEEYNDSFNSKNLHTSYKKFNIFNLFRKNEKNILKSFNKKRLDFIELKENDRNHMDKTNYYNDTTSTSEERYLSQLSSQKNNSKLLTSNITIDNECKLNTIALNKYLEYKQNAIILEANPCEYTNSLETVNNLISSRELSFNFNYFENYIKKNSKNIRIASSPESPQKYKKSQNSMKSLSSINKSLICFNKRHYKRFNTAFEFLPTFQNKLSNSIRRKTMNIITLDQFFTNNNSFIIPKSASLKMQSSDELLFENKIISDSQNIDTLFNNHKIAIDNNYKISKNSFLEIREAW
ncbi:hypothetical protein PCANB_001593 [Pneumocystis canis]|nr:hypothetical protein PCK1_001585 [Pneumocystis canis]KAG5439294.1 hypothetical protein PCANB_001593 [Pneumocystis canis]